MGTGWLHVAEVRDPAPNPVEAVKVKWHFGFAGNRHEMQYRVGAPSKSHVHPYRIFKASGSDDITGENPFPDKADRPFATFPCYPQFFGINCRCGCAAREGHSHGFGHASHGICRVQPLAAPAAGHGTAFQGAQLILVHTAGSYLSHSFKDVDEREFPSFVIAGKHRPSGQQDGRDIDSCRCHQHPGDDLVAGADHDHPVKPVSFCHQFDGVCNVLSRREGVSHPFVTHRDAIADPYHAELKGHPPGCCNALPDLDSESTEVDMPGHNIIPCIGNTDERLFELLFCNPK